MKAVFCDNCGQDPIVVPEQKVHNKGPADGVTVSRAYVQCPCGWRSADCSTAEYAIKEWNRVMED